MYIMYMLFYSYEVNKFVSEKANQQWQIISKLFLSVISMIGMNQLNIR